MDKKRIEEAVRIFLKAIGEDLEREGLKQTPERVARMAEELFSGPGRNPREELKPIFREDYDELVLIRDIPIFSICEHHLLPFMGKAHIAYIPEKNRVVGLSKLIRVIDIFAKRLQLQERLTTQIANTIMKILKPKGVLVIIEAEHLCLTMRGVKKPGSFTVTSAVRGIFLRDIRTRSEAMSLINK